jgi:hypothetical protein
MEVWIIVGVIALVAAAIGFSIHAAAKRRKALTEWAQKNGLTFSGDYEYGVDAKYSEFSIFSQGDNRYACNTLAGSYHGRPFRGFDYHYETYSTDKDGKRQTHSHWFSAVILTSEVPLRPLHIRPESMFDKFVQFIGFDDINFESAEFSRTFHVSSPDKKWAFDVLHGRAMEYLLERPQWTIEFGTRDVCVTMGSACFGPEDFGAAAEVARGLLDLLPQYVREQQATR